MSICDCDDLEFDFFIEHFYSVDYDHFVWILSNTLWNVVQILNTGTISEKGTLQSCSHFSAYCIKYNLHSTFCI